MFQKQFEKIQVETSVEPPYFLIPPDANRFFEQMAEKQKQSLQSSKPMSKGSEATGLKGELGVFRLLGFQADWALNKVTNSLGVGDSGIDLELQGLKMDVKTTTTLERLFIFSTTNQHRERAKAIIFVNLLWQEETTMGVVLGVGYKSQIVNYMHPFERNGRTYNRVRFDSLKRDGHIIPIQEFMHSNGKWE